MTRSSIGAMKLLLEVMVVVGLLLVRGAGATSAFSEHGKNPYKETVRLLWMKCTPSHARTNSFLPLSTPTHLRFPPQVSFGAPRRPHPRVLQKQARGNLSTTPRSALTSRVTAMCFFDITLLSRVFACSLPSRRYQQVRSSRSQATEPSFQQSPLHLCAKSFS